MSWSILIPRHRRQSRRAPRADGRLLSFPQYFVCQRVGFMLPFTIIEDFDVLEAASLHVGVGSVANAMYPPVLEAVEPAFRRRVIPAVSLAAHRADHAVHLELVLKVMAGVLATPVGVVHQSRCWTLAEPGDGQCIGHDIRSHPRLERPAHNFAVEQVEHDGQVQPAFVSPQVGNVRRPGLVGGRRREVSAKQIVSNWQPFPCWPGNLCSPALGPCAGCRRRP